VLYEHYSLRAFWHILTSWSGAWRKRKAIMAQKRVSDEYMAGWFRYDPVSRPAPRRKDATVLDTQTKAQAAEG
jgi:hypothetical protein